MRSLPALGLLLCLCALVLMVGPRGTAAQDGNLIQDPSFEMTQAPDRYGRVFAQWDGSKYDGDCAFGVGEIAHTGKTSAELYCATPGKIRIRQMQNLAAGRYRITAYLRGLDISEGIWHQDTEFMFAEKYLRLKMRGDFGWTHLTYVGELDAAAKAGPSFGLWAPGFLWIDDVTMERVGPDTPLTPTPVLDGEEAPIEPPGPIGAGAIRCPRCGSRNMPEWKRCYACGSPLVETHAAASGPPVKTITSFEDGNPFSAGMVVSAHATDGRHALEIDKGYVVMEKPQDWAGYDFFDADFYVAGSQPVSLAVEIRDKETHDYWTRVNHTTMLPPGASTLRLPLHLLYVGEKARPGRNLLLDGITRLVFAVNGNAEVFLDNLRLVRDDSERKVAFDGLTAFDFGTATSPVMDGFTRVSPATLYSSRRGYGFRNARIWRAMDALQPDPLYQDFVCVTGGDFLVDLPNGRYRVFLNLDSPSAYWGDYQIYRERTVRAQGRVVVHDRMDFAAFLKRYYRFWDTEDLPADNTFDKYGTAHFSEKTFDVEVTKGQLDLAFQGEAWANSLSAMVVYPLDKAAEGERFLDYVKSRRRFYFDNSFKRSLHAAAGPAPAAAASDTARGYSLFHRDFMDDVYYDDAPHAGETVSGLEGEGFAGEVVPLTLSVYPLQDLGKGALSVSGLTGDSGSIPAGSIEVGYVSYRISRVTVDGAVYTIEPRYILPRESVAMPRGITRRFWLTVRVPAGTAPGVYTGTATFTPERGQVAALPLTFRVRKGALAAADIPVGPFGGEIRPPWFNDDRAARAFGDATTERSLATLREFGFTMFSGAPKVFYKGFQDGAPVFDFDTADWQMALAARDGFRAVSTYGAGIQGINAYARDLNRMKAAGFTDYPSFIRTVYSAVEEHARQKHWLPVYWNLGDEPSDGAVKESIANARAYRDAFPGGTPMFTIATSLRSHDPADPRLELSRLITVPALNLHDAVNVRQLTASGGSWAFYNRGSRWTFGLYLFKAVRDFGLKYRISWHWNAVGGDPYYALDCREDDYAWANSAPDGRLVPAVKFYRLAAGLSDYRYLLTLERLAKANAGSPAAARAQELIGSRMAAFQLGQADPDPAFLAQGWNAWRHSVADAIEALSR